MPSTPLEQLSYLIVDDMRDMRMNLRVILENLHVKKIFEARSGEEALEQLQRQSVDIVLCDYHLGEGRNGLQTLEEAKGRGLLRVTSAWLLMSADPLDGFVRGVEDAGPDDYLTKPITRPQLQQRLERVVARRRVIGPIEAAIAAGRLDGAARACEELESRFPALRLDLLRLKLRAKLGLGACDEVADLCFGLLTEDDFPWALVALGRAKLAAGNRREARRFLLQVLQKHPLAMEAYDVLARIELEEGDYPAAKRLLLKALDRAPQSLRRQQLLADCASRHGDYAVAEQAYASAVRLGEDSCFARPEDAARLAMAAFHHRGGEAALKVVHDVNRRPHRRRAGGPADWRLLTAQARIASSLGQHAEAAAALTAAIAAHERDVRHDNAEHSLDLVRCCYELGRGEEARRVVRKLVRENFDRAAELALIEALYAEMGVGEEGSRIIEEERQALIRINNDGVLLAKEGRFEEGLALLQQAADDLPNNLTVVLNVILATLVHMELHGLSQQVKYVAQEYFGRADRLDPTSPRVARLRERLAALESRSTVALGA